MTQCNSHNRLFLEAISAELNEREIEHLALNSKLNFISVARQARFMLNSQAAGQDSCWDCWRICQKLGFIDSNLKL